MAQIVPTPARRLKDCRLLPGSTPAAGRGQDVSLDTTLCRQGEGYVCVRTPLVSAAMQAVPGVDMAIAMAQLGGMASSRSARRLRRNVPRSRPSNASKLACRRTLARCAPSHPWLT